MGQKLDPFLEFADKAQAKGLALWNRISHIALKASAISTGSHELQGAKSDRYKPLPKLTELIQTASDLLNFKKKLADLVEEFWIAPAVVRVSEQDLKEECKSIKFTISLLLEKYETVRVSGDEEVRLGLRGAPENGPDGRELQARVREVRQQL